MIVIIAAKYVERIPLENFLTNTFPGERVSVEVNLSKADHEANLTRRQYTRGHFQCSIPRALNTDAMVCAIVDFPVPAKPVRSRTLSPLSWLPEAPSTQAVISFRISWRVKPRQVPPSGPKELRKEELPERVRVLRGRVRECDEVRVEERRGGDEAEPHTRRENLAEGVDAEHTAVDVKREERRREPTRWEGGLRAGRSGHCLRRGCLRGILEVVIGI